MQNPQQVKSAAEFIRARLGKPHDAKTAIILGTGLGDWAKGLTEVQSFDYADIPGFVPSTVQSHAGKLTAALVGGCPVWLQQGRFHLYEGRTPDEVCMGVRTLAELGADNLIITNAAGALNPQFNAGGLMGISDHINFTGLSPLTGPNHDAWGDRFPDMSRAYDEALLELAHAKALELGIRLERGIYIGVTGPNLETPAETRAFRMLGADAVGMSTVLEVIAAHHMGLRVLGISCLTNKNLPDCMAETSLEEVIATAGAAANKLSKLLNSVITAL
ncbi:purine-nucleoside phosphorylase [Desulfovibrio ferrophilus]|uniref:Purine nucleoside phosphorylase n=1 Tax=Desulfovibrio ferrophilus TaxID=241368 RepID=A0A2Z6AY54_9BACT|nr:purine-nucleoside phosphorylase [Desulfovibrio ferrophilus]BBD08105.1 purine nucleoside phosphorylase I [Desulfovibrio ferrophilus]